VAKGPFGRLVGDVLGFPLRLLLAALSLAAVSGSQLLLTWLVKLWLDASAAGRGAEAVPRLLGLAAGVTLLASVALLLSRSLVASLNQRLLENLRDRAVGRLLRTRLQDMRRRQAGEVLSRVFADAGQLSGFVETLLKRLLGDGLVAAGALALMFTLDVRLALGACLVVPLAGLLLSRVGRVIRGLASASQREAGELTATLTEQIAGFSTIKGFRTEVEEAERFSSKNLALRRRVMESERWSALLVAIVFFGTGLGLLVGIGWGSRGLSASGLLTFCLYAAQTVEPVRRLSDVHAQLQRALASAARVYELIDLPDLEEDGGEDFRAPVLGEVRLESVRFRHRDETPLLEGVDLLVRPGEAVAIAASSGGGKSTLAGLLPRFLSPQGGRVLLDGVDIARLSLSSLRRVVCVVEQEPFLFGGPLLANLTYGARGSTLARVEEVVELTGLRPLVALLPGGFSAELAEGGRSLSGGQRQRVALARAVLRDPRVLVLDEATSALDGEAEARLFDALATWLSRRTVFVMAHRFSTVAQLPRAVVLDGGRIVADGNPYALLASSPAFASLFAGQVSAAAGAIVSSS
jgi:ABC-type multidrug transport system fused ATPase/permease subunit